MLLRNKPGLLLETWSLYPWGKGREGSMARIWSSFLFSGASAEQAPSDNRISSCRGRAGDIPALSVPAGQEGASYPSQLAHPDSKI